MLKKINNQTGNLLILALFITVVTLVAASGFVFVIRGQIRQNIDVANSMVAYYAAERGIEEGLYQMRQVAGINLTDLKTGDWVIMDEIGEAKWRRDANIGGEPILQEIILENNFFELNLFDLVTQGTLGVKSLNFNFSPENDGLLEISLVEWYQQLDSGTITWDKDQQNIHKYLYSTSGSLNLALEKSYRVRFKAIKDNLKNLSISAYDNSGINVPLAGRVIVETKGQYRGIEQRLQVSYDPYAPLMGMYDYVILTEGNIGKAL